MQKWWLGVVGIVLLAGCGQKGPLYLPDSNGEVVTRPTQSGQQSPQQQPSPTDSEKEGSSKQPR